MPARVVAAVAVVHPFPSLLTSALVIVLAPVAGSTSATAVVLGLAMFGFQASIGALNDVVDAPADRASGRGKPLVLGRVSPRTAGAIVIAGGAIGLGVSAAFGLAVLAVGAVGYGSGVAYDLVLRRIGLGWLGFAIAFPALLVWAWLAAAGTPPPASIALLPMAMLAGPAIHLANALADEDVDRAVGVRTLATDLGPERGLRVGTAMVVAVFALGWFSLLLIASISPVGIVAGIGASAVALIGVALMWRPDRQARRIGWMLQAGGVAVMGAAWLGLVAAG